MRDEELAAIRERVEKATPGPWKYDDFAGSIYTQHADHRNSPWVADAGENDGPFIVHAREDIPALLADRARLFAFVRRVARIGRVIPPGDQYDIALLDTLVGEACALLASEG